MLAIISSPHTPQPLHAYFLRSSVIPVSNEQLRSPSLVQISVDEHYGLFRFIIGARNDDGASAAPILSSRIVEKFETGL